MESILMPLDASTLILGGLALLMATCYLFVVIGERIEALMTYRRARRDVMREYWKVRR